jgi:hypothetical protein
MLRSMSSISGRTATSNRACDKRCASIDPATGTGCPRQRAAGLGHGLGRGIKRERQDARRERFMQAMLHARIAPEHAERILQQGIVAFEPFDQSFALFHHGLQTAEFPHRRRLLGQPAQRLQILPRGDDIRIDRIVIAQQPGPRIEKIDLKRPFRQREAHEGIARLAHPAAAGSDGVNRQDHKQQRRHKQQHAGGAKHQQPSHRACPFGAWSRWPCQVPVSAPRNAAISVTSRSAMVRSS